MQKSSMARLIVPFGEEEKWEVTQDIAKMPSMLVSGTTGSGKTAFVRSVMAECMRAYTPADVRFIVYDSNGVDYDVFQDNPFMFSPVVKDEEKAGLILEALQTEIEKRMRRSYALEYEPHLIYVVDDLRLASTKEFLEKLSYLMLRARAFKIHFWLVTSTPTKEVLPVDILLNIMCRVCFRVTSREFSKMVLDSAGAEYLYMPGEMICIGPDGKHQCKAHYLSDNDLMTACAMARIKYQAEPGIQFDYLGRLSSGGFEEEEELLPEAIETVVDAGQASVSMLQRRFRIGYNRASRIIDTLEEQGIIGPADGERPRQVLLAEEELSQIKESMPPIKSFMEVLTMEEDLDVDQPVLIDNQLMEAIEIVVNEGEVSIVSLMRQLKMRYGLVEELLRKMEKLEIIGPSYAYPPRQVLISKLDFERMKKEQFSST